MFPQRICWTKTTLYPARTEGYCPNGRLMGEAKKNKKKVMRITINQRYFSLPTLIRRAKNAKMSTVITRIFYWKGV